MASPPESQFEMSEVPDQIPDALRHLWSVAALAGLGWYFLGTLQSLEAQLAPFAARWPWLARVVEALGP